MLDIVQAKLKMSGLSREEIDSISSGRKLKMANSFFAGGHELIIGKRHFIEGASSENAKASSGSMTPEMHYQYINFTIAALKDIYLNNRYARYVTVFQNWLNQAGASFDHLHKQLVAIDGISASNEAEFKMSRENPNVYNDFAVNYAGYQNLILRKTITPSLLPISGIVIRLWRFIPRRKKSALEPDARTDQRHVRSGSRLPCRDGQRNPVQRRMVLPAACR